MFRWEDEEGVKVKIDPLVELRITKLDELLQQLPPSELLEGIVMKLLALYTDFQRIVALFDVRKEVYSLCGSWQIRLYDIEEAAKKLPESEFVVVPGPGEGRTTAQFWKMLEGNLNFHFSFYW